MPRGVVPAGALEPLGRALLDHHRGRAGGVLSVRWDTGEEERLPVEHFFRDESRLDAVERAALERCSGRVLDVGAGAGALALPLLRRGHDVTALELLPRAATVLRERGVDRVVVGDLWIVDVAGPHDTVLALMNGTGLAGTRGRLPALLERLAGFGGPGSRVLVDSTDPGSRPRGDGRAPGESQIQLGYDGERGPPFPHLFVDADDLGRAAREVGLRLREVVEGEEGRFLAVLVRERGRRT